MGILAGFISGTARAAAQIADQRIARYTAEELQRQRDLMEQEREKRLEEAQIARENRAIAQRDKDRTDMVSRIDAESNKIAAAEIAKQKGLIFEKEAAPSLTPERLDQIDKELEAKRQELANSDETRFRASINTGDVGPKDAQVLLDSKKRIEVSEKQQEAAAKAAEMKNATELYKAKLKEEADIRRDETNNRRVDALFARIMNNSSGSSNPNKELLSILSETRKDLQSNANRITDQMNTELAANKFDPEEQKKIRTAYAPKLAEIEKQQANLTRDFDFVRTKLGLPSSAEPSAASGNKGNESVDPLDAAIRAKLNSNRGASGQAPAPATNSTPAPRGLIDDKKPAANIAQQSQSLESILSGGATDKSVTALASRSAQQIKAVADEVKTAGRAYAAAAASGDARVSKLYQDKLNESKRKLDDLLRNMNDSTQESIRKSLGL